MVTKLDTKTPTVALAILLCSLIACKMFKKKEDEELPAVASASASPAASQPVVEKPKAPEEPKLGDVKRFKDKEKEAEGVVKVLEADVKVFNEPDSKAPFVAELNKDIFVNRLATLDDFVLVEFPSGVGELSPGWVQAKFLSTEDSKVSQDKVKEQQTAAKLAQDKPAVTKEAAAETAKAEDTKATEAATEAAKAEAAKAEAAKAEAAKAEAAKAEAAKAEAAKAEDTKPAPTVEKPAEKPRRRF